MNRIGLGIVLGMAAGLADLALMAATKFPANRDVKMGAFSDRVLIGFFVATTMLPVHPVLAGALVGGLISLPPAFVLKEYAKVLISGIVFGALIGFAVQALARP